MPTYTFYPCLTQGHATAFESFELADDITAYDLAATILKQHASANYVAVWCGERKVCSVPREGVSAEVVTSRRRPVSPPSPDA